MPALETLQEGTMEYGRVTAVIKAVIFTILGLIMIISGIYLIVFKKNNQKEYTDAIVSQDTTCQNNCSVPITFTFQNKQININVNVNQGNNKTFYKGDIIKVLFDPTNVNVVSVAPPLSSKTLGIILIIIGFIFIIGSWINVYLTKKYKSVATVEGAADILGTIRHVV